MNIQKNEEKNQRDREYIIQLEMRLIYLMVRRYELFRNLGISDMNDRFERIKVLSTDAVAVLVSEMLFMQGVQ